MPDSPLCILPPNLGAVSDRTLAHSEPGSAPPVAAMRTAALELKRQCRDSWRQHYTGEA